MSPENPHSTKEMNSFISVPLSSLAMTLFYMLHLKKILNLTTELFDIRFLSWILKASNFFKQYLNIGIYRNDEQRKKESEKRKEMWKEIQISEVTIIRTRGKKSRESLVMEGNKKFLHWTEGVVFSLLTVTLLMKHKQLWVWNLQRGSYI